MKFVGVREFKQDVVKYLNKGSEIAVMKGKKPIAKLISVRERTRRWLSSISGGYPAKQGYRKKKP